MPKSFTAGNVCLEFCSVGFGAEFEIIDAAEFSSFETLCSPALKFAVGKITFEQEIERIIKDKLVKTFFIKIFEI